jgi:hypothetical protein
MVDATDTQGVPIDDSEMNDPGSDNEAPDPLIGEEARSGAIANSGALDQAGARAKAGSRFSENEDEMTSLRNQYQNVSKQQSDAYSKQKELLDAATQRLLGLQAGPTDQEMLYRIGAAGGAPGSFNIGNVNAAKAEGLKEQREAEMQKQQLIAQYGLQGTQATIGAANSRLGQLTQQERIAQSGLNSSGNQMFRGQSNLPWYVKPDGQGGYTLPAGAEKIMDQQAMSKLFGRFTLLPQPDGSKKIVMLGGQSPGVAPAAAPPAPPVVPPSPAPPAAAQPPRVPVPATPGAPPAAPQAPAPSPQPKVDPLAAQYSDLFLPSTVLSPQYGALTPQTKPAYVATAAQAFDPQYFKGYQWNPQHIGDDKIRMKQIEQTSGQMSDAAQGAEATIYNYGNALQNMDKLGDPNLLTGPAGAKIGAFENTLRGVLGNDLTSQITNDPSLKGLATQQDTDKYFLNAATAGLKAIYGGRITNMEVQQRLKSLPSNNLLPAVTRMLASAQGEVAQDTINRSKLWSAYIDHNGDPNQAKFNTWYEANFSPFHASRLKDNLTAEEASIAAKKTAPPGTPPQAISPLATYYMNLGKWKQGGQQGPKPTIPGT